MRDGRADKQNAGARNIQRTLKTIILAALLFFIGRYVWQEWQAVERANMPDPLWFGGGTVFALGSMLVSMAAYRAIICGHGARIAYSKTLAVFFLPLLGKYVPGKIWSVVAAVEMYHRLGIARRIGTACITLFMALGLASAILVTLAFGMPAAGPWTTIGAAGLLAPILAVVLWPRAFYAALNRALRLLRKEPIATRLSAARLLRVLATLTGARLSYGLAFCLLVMSVARVELSAWPGLIALFTFAQIAGLLALFAPAGLGVREGVLLVGLQPLVGPGPAIVITAVCRFWQTTLELIMAAIGWWALRKSKPPA